MPDEEVLYQVVAARRLQWDNLLWQVPVLSLTAQAFLFTIALGGDTSRTARVLATMLSLIATVLSVTLMSRHRQAEIADAHWLEEWEMEHFGADAAVHGRAFQRRRDRESVDAGWFGRLPVLPGFVTWAAGLGLFGLIALAILVVTLVAPELLSTGP